ncbi:MAG: anti-sigma factor antagonist [Chloroflexota bacterium]
MSAQSTYRVLRRDVLSGNNGTPIDVIQAEGRLDAEAAPALESELNAALHSGHTRVVLDLSRVTYISSSALRVLVGAWRRARAHGGDVILASLSPRVREIFEMVGFDRVFTIHETAPQAISAPNAGQPAPTPPHDPTRK